MLVQAGSTSGVNANNGVTNSANNIVNVPSVGGNNGFNNGTNNGTNFGVGGAAAATNSNTTPPFGFSVNGMGWAQGGYWGGASNTSTQAAVIPPSRTVADGPMEIVRLSGPLTPTVMGVREVITNGHVSRVSGVLVQEYLPTRQVAAAQTNSFARVYAHQRVPHRTRTFARVVPKQTKSFARVVPSWLK